MCISLSGGILIVPREHRQASQFINNSGFYLTTNVCPDFGKGLDGEAIKKGLKVFETKLSKHKDISATGKLRFFLINQYIFEVDLVHIQHVTNFETTINSWTLVAEKSILDVAGAADPSLCILGESIYKNSWKKNFL